MNITLVISDLSNGGAQRVLTLLANSWDEKGYNVTLVTLDDGLNIFYNLNPNIKVVPANVNSISKNPIEAVYNNFKRIKVLRRVLLNTEPNVIFSFLVGVNTLVILATLFCRVKVIVSERNNPNYWPNRRILWMFIRRCLYPLASHLVVQTEGAMKLLKFYNQNITIIPNPVSTISNISPIYSPELNFPTGNIIIATGRLVQQKGFDLLLRVFSKVVAEFPNWNLLVIGEGDQKGNLKIQCEKLNISEKVYFLGSVKDIFQILRRSDIFVLSSRYEGFPNVLLEAMACGLPVVSFDCPFGPLDIIEDGMNGLLVDNGNVDQMFEKITFLIRHRDFSSRLGYNALAVKNNYSINNVIKQWSALL